MRRLLSQRFARRGAVHLTPPSSVPPHECNASESYHTLNFMTLNRTAVALKAELMECANGRLHWLRVVVALRSFTMGLAGCVGLALVALILVPTAAAEMRATIWQLPLGQKITAMPERGRFGALACGSNGGPPLRKLQDWNGFQICKPEADGLREVYVEYDRKAELAASSAGQYLDPAMIGTSEALFPVIASALFDAGGVLRGIRLVTDPRPDTREATSLPRLRRRGEHYLLGGYLAGRFGIEAGECHDLAAAAGETPVIGQFVKRDCLKTVDGFSYRLQQRYLRKRGQHDIDANTGHLSENEFESSTRLDVRLTKQGHGSAQPRSDSR
jgi:hypothetical protein